MSKDAVLRIKEAEDEAKRIIDEAHAEAQKRVTAARSDADKACDTYENELREDFRGRLMQVRETAEQIIERSRTDSAQQYKIGEAMAKRHMNDAVKVILQGVEAQCR